MNKDQVDFFLENSLVYGIQDDLGIESIIHSKNWDSLAALDKLIEDRFSLELRCRFN